MEMKIMTAGMRPDETSALLMQQKEEEGVMKKPFSTRSDLMMQRIWWRHWPWSELHPLLHLLGVTGRKQAVRGLGDL